MGTVTISFTGAMGAGKTLLSKALQGMLTRDGIAFRTGDTPPASLDGLENKVARGEFLREVQRIRTRQERVPEDLRVEPQDTLVVEFDAPSGDEGPPLRLPFGLDDVQREGKGWMVIHTDGLNRDTEADYVVCRDCRSEQWAKKIAKHMQDAVIDETDWYIAVPHDYKLNRGMWDYI